MTPPLIPCNRPYSHPKPDWGWLAGQIGLEARLIRNRLHKLKDAYGLGGADNVIICLDNGILYDAASGNDIGDLHNR